MDEPRGRGAVDYLRSEVGKSEDLIRAVLIDLETRTGLIVEEVLVIRTGRSGIERIDVFATTP